VTATRWLWAVFTVAAAFAQTIRNAMQRELTAALGTAGATQVRFLFGFPIRACLPGHFGCQDWRAAATPRIDVLGQGTGWGIYSDPRDGAYAGRDG
jgi:hypothetical protein